MYVSPTNWDWYSENNDVLDVPKSADKGTIKKAYFKLAKQFHPDTNKGDDKASEKFKEVTEAYEVLSDDKQRELYDTYGHAGVELFVYGRHAFDGSKPAPKKFPARHTLEACEAVARLHGLSDDGIVYIQQNPDIIDQGVFHNDVISVGNQNVLFYHQQAFFDT